MQEPNRTTMRSLQFVVAIALGLCLIPAGHAQVRVPNEFEAGTPARAAEVNENFAALGNAIDANGSAIADLEQSIEDLLGPRSSPVSSGSPASTVLVAATGGDYADLFEAVANIETGDAWCRQPAEEFAIAEPCVVRMEPGVYVTDQTIVVPAFVSLIGAGAGATTIRAAAGVRATVQLGVDAPLIRRDGISLRDIAVENRYGDGSTAIAITTVDFSAAEVSNLRAYATGSDTNVAIAEGIYVENSYRSLRAEAEGGTTSIGFEVNDSGSPTLENCYIRAADATVSNIGVDNVRHQEALGHPRLENCEIIASGGQQTTGIRSGARTAQITIRDSELLAANGVLTNIGFAAGGLDHGSDVSDAVITAVGSSSAENVAIRLNLSIPSYRVHRFDGVRAQADGGQSNIGLLIAGFALNSTVAVTESELTGGVNSGPGFGIRVERIDDDEVAALEVERSVVSGRTGALHAEGAYAGRVHIAFTRLVGPVTQSNATVVCAGVYDGQFAFLPDTCPL
jgi:hypothetical protein